MMRRWDLVPVAVACATVAILVGVFYFGVFQHSTYGAGPYLYDTGLFNYIVGPDSRNLEMPSAINMPSFYYVHISPILVPFSFISRLLGLKEFQPLEMVLILGFSGAAAAAFVAIQYYLRPLGRIVSIALAATFAIAFALSGIMRTTAAYPHIEILYVPLAVTALLLIFHRRMRWAWVAFVLCLLVREDAGLEMACILGAYLFLAAIAERGIPERMRDLLPFVGVALAYPALALLAQNALLPIESNFARIYSGAPAYAHLNATLLAHRWDVLTHEQPQALITLASCLACFALRPRWIALTGLLASLPWFLAGVTAYSETAGSFSLYYAFPFLVLPLVPFIVTAELPSAKVVYVDHL
ncbi:MAG: hypothetical protein JWO72_1423 [Caulobacteraceae bacterium]|nr:hypothetical protein [Caulobacteraceae bacterium]